MRSNKAYIWEVVDLCIVIELLWIALYLFHKLVIN
jgi:hypothetical protein